MKTTRFSAFSLVLLSLAIVACSGNTSSPPADNGNQASVPTQAPLADDPFTEITVDRTSRESVSAAILEAFAQNNWTFLATVAAPDGVRFTPYTHVDLDNDQTFTAVDIAAFGTDTSTKTWGTTEGAGEPIDLTNLQYVARYVWDHDYRTAPDVRWNQEQTRGSMIDNVADVYEGASFVEYHFPGFDDQYGGMDWRSLRLVLAQGDDGNWVLYGVIHDEWTP